MEVLINTWRGGGESPSDGSYACLPTESSSVLLCHAMIFLLVIEASLLLFIHSVKSIVKRHKSTSASYKCLTHTEMYKYGRV
jgi:hypothetical protein